MKSFPPKVMMSRRSLLLSGITLLGSYVATSSLPTWAIPQVAPEESARQARFMRLSGLLVNHRLNPAVGARMVPVALAEHAGLDQMMNDIIAIADKQQATTVEAFFGDIPEGPLQALAHWIIFAWYTGCSSPKRDAKVFTYEEALTYQTTSDVVTIPSYGISGPNRWRQDTVPLADMPRF